MGQEDLAGARFRFTSRETTIGSPRADFIMARSDSAPIYRAAERLIHYHIRLIERVWENVGDPK